MSCPERSLCPRCPDSNRRFLFPHGLRVHIGRVHKCESSLQCTSGTSVGVLSQPLPRSDPPGETGAAVDWSSIAALRKKVRVLRHVPKGARCAAASKLSHIVDKCVRNNEAKDWYTLLTFSYTALKLPDSRDSRSLTAKVKENVVSGSVFDEVPLPRSSLPSRNKLIEHKVHDGDLRGAVRLLMSDSRLASCNENTLSALREKHPSPCRTSSMPSEPDSSVVAPTVTVDQVAKSLGSFYSGSAAGLDGLRPGHLKELTSFSAGDNGHRLLESLTGLCNFMLKGMVNREVCPILYGASLCALEKKDGGIRPIAVGSVLRRLVAKLGCDIVRGVSSYLQPHQLGFGTALGCEAAIHATRTFAITGESLGHVIVKLDIKNAFNCVDRNMMLREVQEHVPPLYPFLHQCYERPSQLFYDGSTIPSQTGAQQGDPLGPLIFSLAIHKIVTSINTNLNVWYLDDGTIGGAPDTVFDNVSSIISSFRDLGLIVNTEKCELFPCDPQLSPLQRFQEIVPGIKLMDRSNFTLLGAPIYPEALPAALQQKKQTLLGMRLPLKDLSAHISLTLIRNCLALPRSVYFLRTAPVWEFHTEVDSFDDALRDILEETLNVRLTDTQWSQAALPVRYGGLGVRRMRDLGLPSFLSSSHGVADLVTRVLAINGDEVRLPYVEEALSEWVTRSQSLDIPEHPEVQRSWDDILARKNLDCLLQGSCGKNLARLRAVSRPESGTWLHALPSPHLGTFLDNDSLRIAWL